MNPLSALAYYRCFRKRLLLLFLPGMRCVMVLCLILGVMVSCFLLVHRAFVVTRKAYTSIQAKGKPISLDTIAAIRLHENTARVAPCILSHTEITSLLSRIGVRVYLLGDPDMRLLMERMDVSLVSGRLPAAGSDEIVLHDVVARNKGLAVGDRLGSDLDPSETLLGAYTLVGLLEGDALCGFASLENWQTVHDVAVPEEYGILVMPQPGRLAALNQFVAYLPLSGNELSSLPVSTATLTESANRIYLLLNTVFVAVLLIDAISVSFLTYLFTLSRSREFAVLNAIGYSRRAIFQRSLLDVLILNLLAAATGLLFSLLVALGLQATFFLAAGRPLTLLSLQVWLPALCVPLASVLAEMVAIRSIFSRLDPMQLLDQDA